MKNRNIFGPSVAGQETDYSGRTYPAATNQPMGETGVDNNTTQARHAGMVSDHQSASAREAGRSAAMDNHSGAGMVIGSSTPLTTEGGDGGHGDHDADAPNQGTYSKTIAGTDSFSTSGDGDSGPQTGAGKVL